MIVRQGRIEEGIMAGRLTRVQGREFLQRIKDRPVTPEERAEISSRLDSLERDINQAFHSLNNEGLAVCRLLY
ncbi:MAG: hypothetical protein HW390_3630 [Candidatus Brocadiaceae bacterium]|nr:hypothetical protein [Candidatus Brocadiaceae bacterium]